MENKTTPISSIRVEKNERHWYITIFNRGGNAGTLCVDAVDGESFVNALKPLHVSVISDDKLH